MSNIPKEEVDIKGQGILRGYIVSTREKEREREGRENVKGRREKEKKRAIYAK